MRVTPLLAWRVVQLLLGLVLFGIGIGLMVWAQLGVAPWDVLSQGIMNVTPLTFGTVTVLVGIGILLLWIPLRVRPGLGTVLNVLIIGPVAEIVLGFMPPPGSGELWVRILVFVAALLIVALGTGLYIGAMFGPGPRDGLMTGLHRVTGWPIWVVRTGIEVTVLAAGWLLGGNVGLGTLAFALLIGPFAQPALRWFDLRPRIERSATKRLARE